MHEVKWLKVVRELFLRRSAVFRTVLQCSALLQLEEILAVDPVAPEQLECRKQKKV